MIGLVQEVIGVLFLLLLLERFEKGGISGHEGENLFEILLSEAVEGVPKPIDSYVERVIRSKTELRVKFCHLSHVGELSQMFLKHALEQSSHYILPNCICGFEVNPEVEFAFWQQKEVVSLEKSLHSL